MPKNDAYMVGLAVYLVLIISFNDFLTYAEELRSRKAHFIVSAKPITAQFSNLGPQSTACPAHFSVFLLLHPHKLRKGC